MIYLLLTVIYRYCGEGGGRKKQQQALVRTWSRYSATCLDGDLQLRTCRLIVSYHWHSCLISVIIS